MEARLIPDSRTCVTSKFVPNTHITEEDASGLIWDSDSAPEKIVVTEEELIWSDASQNRRPSIIERSDKPNPFKPLPYPLSPREESTKQAMHGTVRTRHSLESLRQLRRPGYRRPTPYESDRPSSLYQRNRDSKVSDSLYNDLDSLANALRTMPGRRLRGQEPVKYTSPLSVHSSQGSVSSLKSFDSSKIVLSPPPTDFHGRKTRLLSRKQTPHPDIQELPVDND